MLPRYPTQAGRYGLVKEETFQIYFSKHLNKSCAASLLTIGEAVRGQYGGSKGAIRSNLDPDFCWEFNSASSVIYLHPFRDASHRPHQSPRQGRWSVLRVHLGWLACLGFPWTHHWASVSSSEFHILSGYRRCCHSPFSALSSVLILSPSLFCDSSSNGLRDVSSNTRPKGLSL